MELWELQQEEERLKLADIVAERRASAMTSINPARPQSQPIRPSLDGGLDAINAMDREQLLALVTKMGQALGVIACLDDTQRLDAMRLKIANLALTAEDNKTILQACNDYMDRIEGKSVTRIVTDNTVTTFDATAHREQVRQQALDYMNRLARVTLPASNHITIDG